MAPLLYELTIPIFISGLESLKQIVKKGEAWAQKSGMEEEKFMALRLREDMLARGSSPLLHRRRRHFIVSSTQHIYVQHERHHPLSEYALPPAELTSPIHLSFTFQIQTACNTAKHVAPRVAGVEDKVFPDNEKTFADVYKRLDDTIAYLKAVKPEAFEGKEKTKVEVKTKFADLKFTGLEYIQRWALPNYFFHVTTAYAVLRKEGVDVGKWDYLGPLKETHLADA